MKKIISIFILLNLLVLNGCGVSTESDIEENEVVITEVNEELADDEDEYSSLITQQEQGIITINNMNILLSSTTFGDFLNGMEKCEVKDHSMDIMPYYKVEYTIDDILTLTMYNLKEETVKLEDIPIYGIEFNSESLPNSELDIKIEDKERSINSDKFYIKNHKDGVCIIPEVEVLENYLLSTYPKREVLEYKDEYKTDPTKVIFNNVVYDMCGMTAGNTCVDEFSKIRIIELDNMVFLGNMQIGDSYSYIADYVNVNISFSYSTTNINENLYNSKPFSITIRSTEEYPITYMGQVISKDTIDSIDTESIYEDYNIVMSLDYEEDTDVVELELIGFYNS